MEMRLGLGSIARHVSEDKRDSIQLTRNPKPREASGSLRGDLVKIILS